MSKSEKTNKTWMTKYGPRRVRFEPPTLEEALFAAEDLATDKSQQIEIAAELMSQPVEAIRANAERIIRDRSKRQEIAPARRGRGGVPSGPVVVERKFPKRVSVEFKKGAVLARGHARSV